MCEVPDYLILLEEEGKWSIICGDNNDYYDYYGLNFFV